MASSVRDQLFQYGFGTSAFEGSREEVERLLAGGDAVGLAKLLARIYGGFCPEQYDNELNVRAHETLTGPEIEQQLVKRGGSLSEFNLVCAFGTGGTSTGLSRYVQDKFGRKSVHVVFPLANQDVAGIRTRKKALGLKFYEPRMYAGEHEVDFAAAKRTLAFFVRRSYDIGESSAIALYATLQMVSQGAGERFVVILADGIEKYRGSLEAEGEDDLEGRLEVTLDQARAHLNEYGAVVWTHPGYTPNDEGGKLVVAALNGRKGGTRLEIARPIDVARAVVTRQVPAELMRIVENRKGRILLVCMSGNSSLRVAQLLSEKRIRTQSLAGGITNLAKSSAVPVSALIRAAS